VREPDGLAMSSRNVYLAPSERRAATVLFRSLDRARQAIAAGERDAARLLAIMHGVLAEEPLAVPDYVELVSADTFEPVMRLQGVCFSLLAVRLGKTRLIDNMLIESDDSGTICSL